MNLFCSVCNHFIAGHNPPGEQLCKCHDIKERYEQNFAGSVLENYINSIFGS